jgi:ankyrin repeat protein
MHKAALEQDIGVLMVLIREYRKLIDEVDSNGYTPLGIAIKEEKYFSAKALIFNGANVNSVQKLSYLGSNEPW